MAQYLNRHKTYQNILKYDTDMIQILEEFKTYTPGFLGFWLSAATLDTSMLQVVASFIWSRSKSLFWTGL